MSHYTCLLVTSEQPNDGVIATALERRGSHPPKENHRADHPHAHRLWRP